MKQLIPLPLLLLVTTSPSHALPSRSAKRGLVYVSTSHSTQDEVTWEQPTSDLTWYYNYSPYPITNYTSRLEFVPMLFSIPSAGDNSFSTQLSTLPTTTHILSFNEPDGPTSQGGTALSASAAAKAYLDILAPLQSSHGNLQLGWPAVTGSPRGLTWLHSFNHSCYALAPKTGCPANFLPVHWYGDFEGLQGYLGQVHALYPGLPIWVTEFADPNVSLDDTQGFFNASVALLDKLAYVQRYSYFGSFRSQDSKVGGNVAMLDQGGGLTDLGVWYLGVNGTGKSPTSVASQRGGLGGSHYWVWAALLLDFLVFMRRSGF